METDEELLARTETYLIIITKIDDDDDEEEEEEDDDDDDIKEVLQGTVSAWQLHVLYIQFSSIGGKARINIILQDF